MHRPTRPQSLAAALAAGALLVSPLAATAAPGRPGEPRYVEGAPGAGDPYLPLAGNGGIDVQHYSLDLRYTPPEAAPAPLEGQLDGVATLTLAATQDLRSFNLDLRGLTATRVIVNGKSMRFAQEDGNELVVQPRPMLKAGTTAQVVVEYGGTTTRPTDLEGALYGWVTTRDGAMVVSQPDGAATWFPTSDHPTDKATYDFTVTVPEGLVAVANGLLTDRTTADGWTTWEWDAPDPMAAYLATASVGDYELRFSSTPSGVPIIDAVDPALPASRYVNLALTGEMMTFFENLFGPYPFVSYGAIVDDDSVGYALETQTRSFFSQRASEGTVAHELVHQWIGNDVAVNRWADIWHNEGWATYGAWLWTEHNGGRTAQAAFDQVMDAPAGSSFWQLAISDPGPLNLFHPAIYDRSAAMLFALREEIGDEAFLDLTRSVVSDRSGGKISTQEYETLAEQVSGQDLTSFFQVWLHEPEKPTDW
ncbi:M1 family metallopeptidase [Ornithinimicrobium pekingense]|uniref:Aminopeptidase N n=1 Tax=Ornithinimicrobium pekingense TaxID=384677 RepID=A0ABQ2F7S5_9MICO|nr:M1 family metallopeptidase [Ornithinimicrobium pekingense]GGK68134.1 peptidase [Ornithinimicrobium pekingense]